MKYFIIICFSVLLMCCEQAPPAEAEEGVYSIASDDYVELTTTALEHLTSFDFESWGMLLADDVEYYFPDGDENTRTKLIGKEDVLGWWNDWKASSGVTSMEMSNMNKIPIHAKETQKTTGVSGNFVLAWLTTQLSFENGNSVSLRMNMDFHFNDAKLIDRIWSYYDRTGIIEAMGGNILQEEEEEPEY